MDLTFNVKQTPNFVFDYLTDMQKFVSVHPVITQIDKTGDSSYLVHETLKMGFLPISFTYPVIIENSKPGKVVKIKATVMKLTQIEMEFVLKEVNGFTLVEENIQFKSPLPLKSVMQSIFRKQHSQLFKNIELELQ